tara:strand:+ start:273 stop:482 length:210 start_codon:yes stop_codon:yes gene_type:complete
MYITVLDFTEGRVHQYDITTNDTHPNGNRIDWPDSEAMEDFLMDKGHRLTDCEWMSHADGELITDKAEI